MSQNTEVQAFITKLKRKQLCGSFDVASETARLFQGIINRSRADTPEKLILQLKDIAQRLIAAAPIELAIGNVARRVIYFVREEASGASDEPPEVTRTKSVEHCLVDSNSERAQTCKLPPGFRSAVIRQIVDFLDEVASINTNVGEQSLEHIHAKEVILSHGLSRTVVSFLSYAAQKGRNFEVMVTETAPRCSGHELASALSAVGIQVTLIPDSAVFAVMSRVNKVIVGTHAVLANGGLCARSGMHSIALAAKHHNVPLVVCCGLYKLSPLYPHDQDTFNQLRSPDEVLHSDEAIYNDFVRVLNPEFDYVPPELVSLFITNLGGHNPSYIYRLLAELYSSKDYSLNLE